jgi:hypothetical protein
VQCHNVAWLSCDIVLAFIGSVSGNGLSVQDKVAYTCFFLEQAAT